LTNFSYYARYSLIHIWHFSHWVLSNPGSLRRQTEYAVAKSPFGLFAILG
jgi:hypothetical protein